MPIKTLDLSDNKQITDDGLEALQGLPLKALRLKGPSFTSKATKALRGLPIATLDLTGIDIGSNELESLDGLPLRTLYLKGSGITNQEFKVLQKLPMPNLVLSNDAVRVITFGPLEGKNPPTVNLSGFLIYPDMPESKPAAGSGTTSFDMSDADGSVPELKTSEGLSIKSLSVSGIWFTDAPLDLKRLQGVSNIGTLSLNVAAIKEEEIKTLHRLPIPALAMDFTFTEKTGKDAFMQLDALHGLPVTALGVHGDIDYTEDFRLRGLPIATLSLTGLNYPDRILKASSGLPITTIDLSGGSSPGTHPTYYLGGLPIVNLNLSRTRETQFENLHGLPITNLDLSYDSSVYGDSLQALQKLPLRSLNLRGTPVDLNKSLLEPAGGNATLLQLMLIIKWTCGVAAVAMTIGFLIRWWRNLPAASAKKKPADPDFGPV